MAEKPFICDELLEGILREVPLKQRTRFKCVSISWNQLITRLRHTSPLTSGLAFSSKKPCAKGASNYQLILLEVNDRGETCSIHSSFPHNLPRLIDSCNGLLLFGVKDGSSMSYHVFSPMRNRWLQLPFAHDFSRLASASLAFDGVGNDFKVICHFSEEADTKNGIITYQIFSSKTWEWREFSARIHNSALLFGKESAMIECSCPCLYRKGKVYWIWSLFLLVFNEKKDSFELMELPKTKSRNPVMSVHCGKRLWEFEGRLQYCDSTDSGFYIWEYADNSLHDESNKEDCRLMWRPKHYIRLDELISRNVEVFQISKENRFQFSPFIVKICAFNEDLEILYFQLPGAVAAYNFETGRLVKVHSNGAIGGNINDNIYPFVLNAVDLLDGINI